MIEIKKKFIKSLNSIAIGAGLLFTTSIFHNAYAEETPDVCKDKLTQTTSTKNVFSENPSGVISANLTNDFCLGSPDKFELTIFEMGLCTETPIIDSPKIFSKENCAPSMISRTVADLAGKTVQLPPATNRPPSATYTHAYMIISNEFGLKGTISLAGSVYCSTSPDGGVDNSTGCIAEDHTEKIDDFGDSETNEIGNADFGPATMPIAAGGGKVSALLTDNSLTRAIKVDEVTRLVAVFETNSGSEVIISESTKGLEVELQVADFGYGIGFNNGVPAYFGSSPFQPRFTTF